MPAEQMIEAVSLRSKVYAGIGIPS
jgi:hypothetical protein